METVSAPTTRVSVRRRFWPELVLLVGVGFLLIAYGIGNYASGRLVLIGSVNAVLLVGGLCVVAVWCFAVFLLGRGMRIFGRGPDDDGEAIEGSFVDTALILIGLIVQLLVVLGALALTGIIGVLTAIIGGDSHYDLDVPGTSTRFVATTSSFDETSVDIYSGTGITFERVDVDAPFAASHDRFRTEYRVETDPAGSFLVYPGEDGNEARVPLTNEVVDLEVPDCDSRFDLWSIGDSVARARALVEP